MSHNLLINNAVFEAASNSHTIMGVTPSDITFQTKPAKDSYLLANAGSLGLAALGTAGVLTWAVKKFGPGIISMHYISKAVRLDTEADQLYQSAVHDELTDVTRLKLYGESVSKYDAAIEAITIAGETNSKTAAELYQRRAVARAINVKETDAKARVRNVSAEEKRSAAADLTKAIEIYEKLESPPDYALLGLARALMDRADILMSEGNFEAAITDFRTAANIVRGRCNDFDYYELYKNYEIGALTETGRFQEAADEVAALKERDFAAGRIAKGAGRIHELIDLLAKAQNHAAIIREATAGFELLIRLGELNSAKALIAQTTEAFLKLDRGKAIASWLENASDISAQTGEYRLAAEICVEAGKQAEAGQYFLEAAGFYEKAVSHYGKLIVGAQPQGDYWQIVMINASAIYAQTELLVKASLATEMEAFALRARNKDNDAEILFERSRNLRQASVDLKNGIGGKKPLAVIFGLGNEAFVVEPRIAATIEQLRASQRQTFERLSLADQTGRAKELITGFWRLSEAERAKHPFLRPGEIIPDSYVRLAAEKNRSPAEGETSRAEQGADRDRDRDRDGADSLGRAGRGNLQIVK